MRPYKFKKRIETIMQQENIPIKVGLLEFLYGSQGTQFVIPAYQRNCTWVYHL